MDAVNIIIVRANVRGVGARQSLKRGQTDLVSSALAHPTLNYSTNAT